jgi:hypothetical protein
MLSQKIKLNIISSLHLHFTHVPPGVSIHKKGGESRKGGGREGGGGGGRGRGEGGRREGGGGGREGGREEE